MTRISIVSLAIAGLVGLAACGEAPENDDTAEEETDQDEQAEDDGAEEGEDDGDDDSANADETVTVEAGEFFYEGVPETLPAGTIAFDLDNTGEMPHDLVIEELDDEVVVEETDAGESETGTAELEPGEYTIYCSIGNHRAQGMEVTVTVE